MSANPETRFGKRFRNLLPKETHEMRVENPACPGTPDLNACVGGVEFWVEFKFIKSLPKLSSTPVFRGALRPEQILWHYQRSRVGGRTFIVAGVEDHSRTFIIEGKYSREFNDMTLARLEELNLKVESLWSEKS